MSTSKEYFDFISGQLSEIDGIAYRKMMGEYIIYYRDKVAGGIYDDRLLLKPTESAGRLIPNAPSELPYDGAKDMILVENVDDKTFLGELFNSIYDELPSPKLKKKRGQ